MRHSRRLVLLALLAAARPAAAQHAEHGGSAPAPAAEAAAMPLYREALGPFARRVTTGSAQAQAYFDQGVQLMYAFTPEQAARSFREAQRLDARCAMCFWGEAWALGPYLNEPMDSADAPRAVAAIATARRLAPAGANAAERALIDAMAIRYEPVHSRDTRRRLDSAYARAMSRVYAAHGSDLDVGTLYAEALMLLEPRRAMGDAAKPSMGLIHEILGAVLARDIHHPGACHLFVHATEQTVVPEKAEACAEFLGSSIPGASHINHMPSHTFNRVGRWGDAVRANLRAFHSDQRAADGQGFAIYPGHNLHMLLYSASMDGQGAIAVQAARDYARQSPGGAFYIALVLMRFGRFEEALELTAAPTQPIQRGLWDFARSYAHLRRGHADSARAGLERVQELARIVGDSVNFRGHTARMLLGIASGILSAELLRHDNRPAEAVTELERAVMLEDSLRYDEPEPINFSARDWLGAVLLEAGRAAEAEAVYRASLADHPRTGWSLFGLEQSLRAQGRTAEAAQVHPEFETAWTRSDIWLRASRY